MQNDQESFGIAIVIINIEQVVIYLKPSTLPDVFINKFQVQNTFHQYRIIRLWEENPELFLQSPALYP